MTSPEEDTRTPAIEPVGEWNPEQGGLPPSYKLREIEMPLTLPCGYRDADGTLHHEVELAPMTGDEEDMIQDTKLAKDSSNINFALANCLVRVGSAFEAQRSSMTHQRTKAEITESKRIVRKLSLGDFSFLLYALRRISFEDGSNYKFTQVCPNRACGADYTANLDLSDLVINQRQDGEDIRTFTTPRSKQVVRYRHLNVADTGSMAQLQKRHPAEFASAALWLQIVDVDGEKLSSFHDLRYFSSADRDALRTELQKSDGGVNDNDISMECAACGHIWMGDVKVTPSFFVPSSATRPT